MLKGGKKLLVIDQNNKILVDICAISRQAVFLLPRKSLLELHILTVGYPKLNIPQVNRGTYH